MRYAGIALLIILLDQGIKWLMQYTGADGTTLIQAGPITLELLKSSHLPLSSIYAILANSTTLILLLALSSAHLLVTRWSTHSYFISRKTKVGLQLASAGIASHAIDVILSGSVRSTLQLDVAHAFALNVGVADLALLLGFASLALALYQGGSRIGCSLPLAPSNIAPLRFSHLPRGVDNVHIDVLLSPEFCKQSLRVIHNLVPVVIRDLHKGKRALTLPKNFFNQLTGQFNELLHNALHMAKNSGDSQLPNLFYVAMLKFLHAEVGNTVATALQRQKEAVQEHNRRGTGNQREIQLVEWMFRFREHIISTANLTLLNALCGTQNPEADKAIANVLGKHKIFLNQALRTRLLMAESSADEQLQMNHYLILGHQQEEKNSFLNLDTLLGEVFRDYLPLVRENPAQERSDKHLQRDSDTLSQPSVLMHPANITILLDTDWSRKKIGNYSPWREWKKYRRAKQHMYFQKRLRLKLSGALHKSGLASWVNAAYETRTLLRNNTVDISPATLTALLARGDSKAEFTQRLKDLLRGGENSSAIEAITAAWERVQRQGETLLGTNLLHFVQDFARYRHDLSMLFTYQRAAAQINLLGNEKDIRTSRANYSLYEFLCKSERQQSDAPIVSHIIIKADLRGSTDITQKLTELQLNPATHFDRNFFSPINELIEAYGAEKVFIEGDAIILILNERQNDSEGRLVASRACGLAANILQVVAKQNRELAVYGLPQLELGIGIAHCNETPRYLFDQQHRITISPAINRADRLSACAWGVRQWREKQHASLSHVEVYQPSAREMSHGEKAQKDLVYNLNGVLIEAAVFDRLRQELSPKPLKAQPRFPDSELFAIEFPDLSGGHHRLVIRKAAVKVYDPDFRVAECPVVEKRFFYEVLHDRAQLQQLNA
jgi:lipoprotein signal peptidase